MCIRDRDYSFKVIGDCIAKITAVNVNPNDGRRCGTGTVQVSASGTGSSYQWYTDQFGESAIPGATLSTFTTPSLGVGTYTYDVTATNGLCESVIRTPVKAVVSPLPNITFTQSNPDICGNITALTITSSGDKEEVDLLNEKFSTGLGNFANVAQGNTDNNAFWKLQSTPYVPAKPPYYVLSPAMSSGYNGGGFAAIVTDVKQNTSILNHLTNTQNLNSTGYLLYLIHI